MGGSIWCEFAGNIEREDGKKVPCTWRFDRAGWTATDRDKTSPSGEHALGECPVLIFTESGDFPDFGPFSAIADLAKRLFNLDSELDEILRAQTFSLLTMQVPEGSTEDRRLPRRATVGQTVGTSNLMVYSGSTPPLHRAGFRPGQHVLDADRQSCATRSTKSACRRRRSISRNQDCYRRASRRSMPSCCRFSRRMEDLERCAWELSRRWLGMTTRQKWPRPRDFNLADVERAAHPGRHGRPAMPTEVIAEQQKRIIAIQFGGLSQDRKDEISTAIDERTLEVK